MHVCPAQLPRTPSSILTPLRTLTSPSPPPHAHHPPLNPPPTSHRPLSKALAERCMLVVKRTGGGGVAFAPLAPEDPNLRADHNGTVLGLLSAGAWGYWGARGHRGAW